MKVTYFEVFEGRYGYKQATKQVFDATFFALLLTLAKDAIKDADVCEDLSELIFEDIDPDGYLLQEAITDYQDTNRPASILKALRNVGWWAGTGEEGSFGFAIEGAEAHCKNAIAMIEARVATEQMDW